MSKRSSQPFYWALFGAGGMLSALIGAVLVFITGIALPLGVGGVGPLAGYDRALQLAHAWPAKAFLFAVVALFLWHAAHRTYHTLHDFGVRPGAAAWSCCYGVALAGTLAAFFAVLAVGF
jgi:fumarate reductase subunit D